MGKSKNETFQFWLEYCNMVLLLLDFMAAERDSDWKIHLETFQEVIYDDRAFDHYKYFSWGLVYLCDMAELPTKHPALYESLLMANMLFQEANQIHHLTAYQPTWPWKKA